MEARLRERIEGDIPTSTHVMQGLRSDGSVVELEVYSTRTEHAGRPAVTGTMIDATERRERERALEAREQRYRDLLDHAADIVYTCDLDGPHHLAQPRGSAAHRLQRRRSRRRCAWPISSRARNASWCTS